MSKFVVLGGEFLAVLLSILACYLVLLLYRHPHQAKWLQSETASTVALLSLMSAVIVSCAFLIKGLVAVVGDPLGAIALGAAVIGLVSWCLWKLLRMRARLDAAQQGRSPFRLGRRKPDDPRAMGHA